ncbi:MAG: Hpt domain-containing protein, partial [Armatimonadetes bacterium]|nr:Hpt domain-containing protein [Armatimonadota bacterium]
MPQDLYEDEEDLKFFLEETEEHIRTLKEGAKALDGGGAPPDPLLESLYRSAHTIKGSSATFGFPPLMELAQAMEKFLDRARKKTMPLQEDGVALLKEGASGLETLKDALEGRKSPPDQGELAKRFDGFTGAAPKKEKAPSPKSRSVAEAPVIPQDKRLRAILQEGFKRGFKAFQIDLSISPQSPMPFVRAVQATKELERSGRIAHLDPPLQMGKADEFGGSLRMFFVTKLEESEILELADSIYDVENVKIVEISSADSAGPVSRKGASAAQPPPEAAPPLEVESEKPAHQVDSSLISPPSGRSLEEGGGGPEEGDGKREKRRESRGKGEIFELNLQVS